MEPIHQYLAVWSQCNVERLALAVDIDKVETELHVNESLSSSEQGDFAAGNSRNFFSHLISGIQMEGTSDSGSDMRHYQE